MADATTIPRRLTLCAIGYTVTVADNAVIFAAEPGVAGCYTRLMFERRCGCWYVTLVDSDDAVMVGHVEAAAALVRGWFGDDHCCPRGEYKL